MSSVKPAMQSRPEWRPADDELALFNGLSAGAQHELCSTTDDDDEDEELQQQQQQDEEADCLDQEQQVQRQQMQQGHFDHDEEDEEFAMRLDTIVEEDESYCDTMLAAKQARCAADESDDFNCDSGELYAATPSSRQLATSCNNTPTKHQQQAPRPQAEQMASLRKFTPSAPVIHQPSRLEETSNHKMSNLYLNQPIPSTNRLISEHQARQQQALFKALAERQKLGDEKSAGARRRRRQARRLQASSGAPDSDGVPLSLVDLSSMSDRMLDELLGQIAPASSSSSLSSMNSSELSYEQPFSDANSTDSDQEPDHQLQLEGRKQSKLERASSARAQGGARAPNVVGVHEDERAVGQHQQVAANFRRPLECRDAHRRRSSVDHQRRDDDDDHHHEQQQRLDRQQQHLLLSIGDQYESNSTNLDRSAECSLSPAAQVEPTKLGHDKQALVGSRLEHYFTGELIQAHTLGHDGAEQERDQADGLDRDERDEHDDADQHDGGAGDLQEERSVELVLAQMLEALNEIGADEQEQLNELLERGFAHLERLLGCTFSTSHKMISSTPLLVSKDSDYGSDTQSADCLSGASAVAIGSPSPSSLAGAGQTMAGASLSPAAVDLSFKLAESLHRLARQQANRKTQAPRAAQPPPPAADSQPRRSPMKSIVMINQQQPASEQYRPGTSSPSSSSLVSCCSPSQDAGNPTPAKARAQFKTRVNIGTNPSSAVSQLELVASAPTGSPAEAEPSADELAAEQPALQALQRRRSARSSLRRRPSLSGSQSGALRPGSPVPRSLVGHQDLTSNLENKQTATNSPARSDKMEETKQQQQQQQQLAAGQETKQSRQLQRALILAQKYNYSPAKLAASKLNAKLQLNSNNIQLHHDHDEQQDKTGK